MTIKQKANKIKKNLYFFRAELKTGSYITWHMYMNRRFFQSEYKGEETTISRDGLQLKFFTTKNGAEKFLNESMNEQGFLQHYGIKYSDIDIVEVKHD